MNIKKFLIVACFTFQFSTLIYADQAAWNEAFLAFGGGSDVAAAALTIQENSHISSSAVLTTVNAKGKTPEITAVGHFISSKNKTAFVSPFTDADVKKARDAAIASGNKEKTTGTTDNKAATGTTGVTGNKDQTTVTTDNKATTGTTGTTGVTGNKDQATVTNDNKVTDNANPTDTAAIALKTQIDSSLVTYNSYLKSVNQAQVKIVAAA